jgi:hypothetical protein
MTTRQFANFLATAEARLIDEVRKAETKTINDAKAESIKASSGPHTQAALTAAGHPYSRRAPQTAAYPPGIVNAQSGQFRASWQTQNPILKGRTLVSKCINYDPVKKYLNGTTLMVARPLNQIVYAAVAARRIARLKTAIKKALTG